MPCGSRAAGRSLAELQHPRSSVSADTVVAAAAAAGRAAAEEKIASSQRMILSSVQWPKGVTMAPAVVLARKIAALRLCAIVPSRLCRPFILIYRFQLRRFVICDVAMKVLSSCLTGLVARIPLRREHCRPPAIAWQPGGRDSARERFLPVPARRAARAVAANGIYTMQQHICMVCMCSAAAHGPRGEEP